MKQKRQGMTLIEILIVLGIIALLTGLLIPALSVVKNTAKEAKQKAQFNAIDMALLNFKYDYGDYPPSAQEPFNSFYCGAQKLTEALMGWDLLGFHPKSQFNADGKSDMGVFIYDSNSIDKRKGPYLESEHANAFRLGDLFRDIAISNPDNIMWDNNVLCDVFKMTKVTLVNGQAATAGAPILYYRANTSGKTMREIYNVNDNDPVIELKEIKDNMGHPLRAGPYPSPSLNLDEFFYGLEDPFKTGYIQDPKITARPWPYRPDSYLLISAGADGLYGTNDDIRNFGY